MAYPVRLRHPRGVATISVEGTTTLEELKKLVFGQSEIPPSEQDLKYGYPPKPFASDLTSTSPISAIPITRGEQIIVTQDARAEGSGSGSLRGIGNAGTSAASPAASSSLPVTKAKPITTPSAPPKPSIKPSTSNPTTRTHTPVPQPSRAVPAPKAPSVDADAAFAAALQREYDSSSQSSFSQPSAPSSKASSSVTEETVDLPNGGGIMQHRIVPDDNSCLFSSVATVFLGGTIGDGVVKELRGIVAEAIRKDPFEYSEAILGRSREDYISTILKPNSWGGAIELSIFSKHFKTEIDSFDVQSGRADKFGEGDYDSRCLLVYSGIHYDAITTSPIPDAPPEFHTSVFPVSDTNILSAASKLVAKLKEKRYFTDVANFDLRCGVCKMGLKGEKGAREHAKATGHVEFGEY